jgi:hypothetical protein
MDTTCDPTDLRRMDAFTRESFDSSGGLLAGGYCDIDSVAYSGGVHARVAIPGMARSRGNFIPRYGSAFLVAGHPTVAEYCESSVVGDPFVPFPGDLAV